MKLLRCRIACLSVLALLLWGCSGGVEGETETRAVLSVFPDEREDGSNSLDSFGDDAPVVESIRFEPREPVSRQRWRALVDVEGDWTSLRYDWLRNGEPLGRNASEIVLPTLSSGDKIVLRVTPYRGSRSGEVFEVTRVVPEQTPRIRHLSLERVEAVGTDEERTELWRAVVLVEDRDESKVDIEYRWLLNGLESEIEDAVFPAGQLKRGDRLEVRALAFDGRLWSAPASSGEIEIGNTPPRIVSTPSRPEASGYFIYAIRAEDPDGDEDLRFALKEAPSGMKIDEVAGILTWQPSADQAGRHSVEVVVRDGLGGEATQSFSLALTSSKESDADAPGPAARR